MLTKSLEVRYVIRFSYLFFLLAVMVLGEAVAGVVAGQSLFMVFDRFLVMLVFVLLGFHYVANQPTGNRERRAFGIERLGTFPLGYLFVMLSLLSLFKALAGWHGQAAAMGVMIRTIQALIFMALGYTDISRRLPVVRVGYLFMLLSFFLLCEAVFATDSPIVAFTLFRMIQALTFALLGWGMSKDLSLVDQSAIERLQKEAK